MILITGGLGYLGGRLSLFLNEQGYDVRVTTHRKNVKVSPAFNEIDVVEVDLISGHNLDAACAGVDVVIHLAAMNAQACCSDPGKAITVNGLGTQCLVDSAVSQGVKQVIYFSTSHVYASPLQGVISEETLPCPAHTYSITHRLAEDLILQAQREGKVMGNVLRLSNAVGSPVSPDANCWMLFFNDIVKEIVEKKEATIRSGFDTLRDFLAISEICKVVEKMVALPEKFSSQGVFNLSAGNSLSLFQLASLVASRAKIVLGFEPKVKCLQKEPQKIAPVLKIMNSKLNDMGVSISTCLQNEIDAALHDSNNWFGK